MTPTTSVDLLARVRIKAMIMGDHRLRDYDIGVDVTGAVATLTGEVETEAERQIAEDAARKVPDVVDVRNEIQAIIELDDEA